MALTTLQNSEGSTAPLIQATDLNFYGTTFVGGANDAGTVFEITPAGTLTTLYSFCSQSGCTDGANPLGRLVQASDGNFYGTTQNGGTSSACTSGCGTVFRITPGGTLTTLHSFNGTGGEYPEAGLVQAADGNFYGTTLNGGTFGAGIVFKITPEGTLTTLHNFLSTKGSQPEASLIQATDGNLYGTTWGGGANGDGTISRLPLEALSPHCTTSTAPMARSFSAGWFRAPTESYSVQPTAAEPAATVPPSVWT